MLVVSSLNFYLFYLFKSFFLAPTLVFLWEETGVSGGGQPGDNITFQVANDVYQTQVTAVRGECIKSRSQQ